MKIQALLIAVGMAVAGSAFAASDTASTGAATTKPHAGAAHKSKTAKARHKTYHHGKSVHHAKASSTHHMGANRRDTSATATRLDTDLNARDRQSRIDEAYSKWKANPG